jgi:hypothetical protein
MDSMDFHDLLLTKQLHFVTHLLNTPMMLKYSRCIWLVYPIDFLADFGIIYLTLFGKVIPVGTDENSVMRRA